MADVVRAARRMLASEPTTEATDGTDATQTTHATEMRAALADAARVAAADGLRPDRLLAALDDAVAHAGCDASTHEQEYLRATVAALALRAHIGEPEA